MIKLDGNVYEPYPIDYIMYKIIEDKLIEEKVFGRFKATLEDDIIRWHHTFGRWIRNEFLYSKKIPISTTTENCIKLDEQDEDEMSYTIMVQVHSMLNKGYLI